MMYIAFSNLNLSSRGPTNRFEPALNGMSSHSIKHSFFVLMLRALFGERKANSFQGLIGIRMWNRLCGTIRALERKLKAFRNTDGHWNVWTDEWSSEVQNVVDRCWIESDNLYQRATKMLESVRKAESPSLLHDALLHWRRNDAYENSWREMLRSCREVVREFMQYCETCTAMDKKRTWGACAAAVYLIDKKMQTETALKICKELGAITIDDLEGVNRENIYGDVAKELVGLSLSESEKGELNQICDTARAEAAGAKAKADAEAAAAKAAAAKLEVIMSKSRAEPEEMGEGTYSGEKLEGRRHGRGFMFYKNNDTYYGEWRNDKMNGLGEFKKNVGGLQEYDWEFYGKFKDDRPVSGTLKKRGEHWGLQIDVKKEVNVREWDPFERKEDISTLLQQMQELHMQDVCGIDRW